MGANHEMPAPQCMDTTVQTHKFSLQLELFSNETNHKCDKWCLSFCSSTYKSRSSTPGAVNVCNTAIGGTCSTWSLAEPSASSKESVVQEKSKYKTSLNQPQSRNPNHERSNTMITSKFGGVLHYQIIRINFRTLDRKG
ncbi:hypothetical protein YC2023_097180 [Brassica napus]